MNNPIKHVFKPIFLLFLSSIMEHAPTNNKRREEIVCVITQHFEVTEPLTQGAALGWLLLPRWGVWVNYNIIAKKIALFRLYSF